MSSVFDSAVCFIHSPFVDTQMVETWIPGILEFLEIVIVQLDAQLSSGV